MSIHPRKTKNGIVYDVRYREGINNCSKTFFKKSEAREFDLKKATEAMEERNGSELTGKFADTTFATEAEFWLEQMKIELSPGWFRRAKDILNLVLIPKYGHLTPDKFSIDYIRRIQVEQKNNRVKSSGDSVSNATINRVTEVLAAVLNYSVKTRRIPFNPSRGYSKLPDTRGEMAFWELSEVRSFLKFVGEKFPKGHEERWVYAALLTALNGAPRAGELWGLKPGDLKVDTLYIKRQWLEATKEFAPVKGKRRINPSEKSPYRHTALPKAVRQELLDVIDQRQVRSDETIFYGLNRNPRGHRSFAQRFDRLVRDWGGKRIRFHDLRHTAITLWIHAGVNLLVVQEMAGHENILTTMRYAHMVGGSVAKVSQTFFVNENSESLSPLEIAPIRAVS